MLTTERLERNLAAVRGRIAAAATAAGRDPAEVTLVAVSKTRPASDVMALAALGVRDFGESYDQEASRKAGALHDAGIDVTWHFVGTLQRNKCASIARYAGLVHSVDRPEVATALASGAHRAGRRSLGVLVQVRFDDEPGRGGVAPAGAAELAAAVAAHPELALRGVMTVAPPRAEPAAVFAELVRVSVSLRAAHPGATVVSAGMTGDLDEAVAAGATHVRVGTALFGDRPPVLR